MFVLENFFFFFLIDYYAFCQRYWYIKWPMHPLHCNKNYVLCSITCSCQVLLFARCCAAVKKIYHMYLTCQHNYLTSRLNYLICRHNYLTNRHTYLTYFIEFIYSFILYVDAPRLLYISIPPSFYVHICLMDFCKFTE